jgi:hypothetical protein
MHAALETARFDALQDRVAIVCRLHHEQMIYMPAIIVFLRQLQPAARESLPVAAGDLPPTIDPAVSSGKLQRQDRRLNFVEPLIVAVPFGIVGLLHAIKS